MPNWKKVLLNGNAGSLSTLSLTGLSAQNSETDVLTINGSNVVGTRQLGSNAFTSTTIGTTTNSLTVDATTLQLNTGTTFNGSGAKTISAKTAAITEAGTGLATSAQIYTFVTGLGYGSGTVTSVGTNTGLSGTVTTTGNLSLALADLADMTEEWQNNTDEFIVLDNGTQKRKLSSEIFGSNAFTNTTIPTNNNQLSNGAGYLTSVGTINLASGVTDTLPVGNGGTGLTTLTSGQIPYGNGTSAFNSNGAFVFDQSIKQLQLTGDSSNAPLKLTNVQANAEETKVGLILNSTNDGVEKATLGSNAFTSTTIPTNNNQLSNGAGYLTSVGTINLASGVTGTLPVGNGGTGVTSLDSLGLSEFDNDSNFYAAGDTLRAANGTNLAPGISFSGDTNSGFYASNPDEISVSRGGTQSFKFDSNGFQQLIAGGTSQFAGHLQAHCLGIGGTPSTTSGEIWAYGDIVANKSSDRRLKKYIKNIPNALEKVSQINGVTFEWKKTDEKMKKEVHSHEGQDIGVIAQEIEEVLPEIVATRDNGYKAVYYEKLVPLLIEAVKELKAEVDELKKSK